MTRRLILSACALLAACSGEAEQPTFNDIYPVITFSPMYSAFGGSHSYSVTPSLPAVVSPPDSDAPVASTLVWRVDEKLARQQPFDALPAAIKLTARRAGFAEVELQGKFRRSGPFKVNARLNITEANDEDWDRGEARFHSGPRPTLATLLASIEDEAFCERNETATFPQDSACASCHDAASAHDSVMVTPMQIAGYSDEQLIAIIMQGQKPAGGTFNSELLREHPHADCIFEKFHAWSVTEEDQPGLVLKLRSLTPQIDQPLEL